MEAMTYKGRSTGCRQLQVHHAHLQQEVVANPPRSDELVTVAKKNTDKAAGRFGLAYAYSDYYYHAALQNAFGGYVFEGGRSRHQQPQQRKAPSTSSSAGQGRRSCRRSFHRTDHRAVQRRQGAMIFNGPWFLGEISKSIDYGPRRCRRSRKRATRP